MGVAGRRRAGVDGRVTVTGMHTLDWVIIGIYLAVLLVAGIWLARRGGLSSGDYFLGGNRLPWWALGTSGMASNLDIAGTMAIVAMISLYGLQGFFIEMRGGVVLPIAVFAAFMGKWHRRSGVMTTAEWMLLRFGDGPWGRAARFTAALTYVVLTVAIFVAVLLVVFAVAGKVTGRIERPLAIVVLVAPAVILSLAGLVVPAIQTIITSMTNEQAAGQKLQIINGKLVSNTTKFVGLDNYKFAFTDSYTLHTLFRTVIWIVLVPLDRAESSHRQSSDTPGVTLALVEEAVTYSAVAIRGQQHRFAEVEHVRIRNRASEERLLERHLLGRLMRAAALDAVADPQQHAVHDQRDRDDAQVVEHTLEALLQQQTDNPGRNRADDQRPHQVPVVVLAATELREETADQRDPARTEIPQQRERGAQVERNQERQQLRRVLVDVHAEQRRHEQRVAEAADGEQFGDALQDAQEYQKPETHASVLLVVINREEKRTTQCASEKMRPDYAEPGLPRQGIWLDIAAMHTNACNL